MLAFNSLAPIETLLQILKYKLFSCLKSRYLKKAGRSKADSHSHSEVTLPYFDFFSSGW